MYRIDYRSECAVCFTRTRTVGRRSAHAMSVAPSSGLSPSQHSQGREQETVTIPIKATVIACGLTLTLAFFSRERPQKGEPPMASAHLTVQKDALKEEVVLSIFGTDATGKTYTTLRRPDYTLELVAPWDYDRTITVRVTRL